WSGLRRMVRVRRWRSCRRLRQLAASEDCLAPLLPQVRLACHEGVGRHTQDGGKPFGDGARQGLVTALKPAFVGPANIAGESQVTSGQSAGKARLADGDSVHVAEVENVWNAKLDPKKGLTVVEIMDAVHADTIKGMYILG